MSRLQLSRRHVLLGATAAVAGTLCPADARAEDEDALPEVKPLTKEQKKALDGIPIDPPPEKLVQDQHFMTSDEHTPERFHDTLRGLGGVYVGVGPEQNYLFTSWGQPDIAIFLDFDQTVVDLHGVYKAFFLASSNGPEVAKLWSTASKPKAIEVLEAAGGSAEELERWKEAYNLGQKLIAIKMKALKLRFESNKIPMFLTSQAHFDFVKAMLKTGRIRAVRGDLTGDQAMNGIAKAATAMSLPVRCQYVSNCENYFDYDTRIDDNMVVQPVDDDSLILRTVFKGESKWDRYHYIIQKTNDFTAWTKRPKIKKLKDIMDAVKMQKKGDAWVLPGPP
jgi:hypothetical protein